MESYKKHHPDLLFKSAPHTGEGKKLIAIGASTGGVDAIGQILHSLPKGLPPIVITQHIPAAFSASFANRLNETTNIQIKEVNERMLLKNSCAYLAHGGTHLVVEKNLNEYYVKPLKGERISRHIPSVDVMFRSVNNVVGKNVLAIIMTGMGDDGCIGIKELFLNGAYTIAQDEKSCVVFGMPKQAIIQGSICEIVNLSDIPNKIIQFSQGLLRRMR